MIIPFLEFKIFWESLFTFLLIQIALWHKSDSSHNKYFHKIKQNTPNMVYKGFGKSVEYWKPLKSPEFSVLKTLRLPLVASPYTHFSWQFVIAELSWNSSVPEYLQLEHEGYYHVTIFGIDRYNWITNPRENPSLSRLEYLKPLVFPKSWVLPKFHPYRPYPYSPY